MDSDRIRRLTQAHLDQRLDDEDFVALQKALEKDAAARQIYVNLARLDAGLKDRGQMSEMAGDLALQRPVAKNEGQRITWQVFAIAALLSLLLLPALFFVTRLGRSDTDSVNSLQVEGKGVAVITAEAGAVWGQKDGKTLGLGVALQPGRVVLEKGLAQIDFFGGASVSLSGPAEIELINRDAAILHRGKIKADVPPAARGFEVRAGEVLLEDLGTSFGLAVGENGKSDLRVFDGEVRASGKKGEPMLLIEGESARLENGEVVRQATDEVNGFPDISDIIAGSGNLEESRYAAWKEASIDRRQDPRILAYYDFEGLTIATRRLRNQAQHGQGAELDGGIVGARVTTGRWGRKTALDFRSEGDRVRFQIPGEFESISIYAWVRIDALDRYLNSLFLTDHFDENELHWQLSSKGALHFSSSPKGVIDLKKNNREFFSDRFWDVSQSGQWFLLATTIDTLKGEVQHYVNGKAVGFSGGTNMKKPLNPIRFGKADLGNWTKPIGEHSSIRTLNGRIDEFAIYAAVLSGEEIAEIYAIGRP